MQWRFICFKNVLTIRPHAMIRLYTETVIASPDEQVVAIAPEPTSSSIIEAFLDPARPQDILGILGKLVTVTSLDFYPEAA